MKKSAKRAAALIFAMALALSVLSGCASDVFGDWVDEKGTVFKFSTNTMSAEGFGEDCPYIAADGEIKLEVENPIFGGTLVLEGTYERNGNTLTLSFGEADSLNFTLTRY